MFFNRFDVEKIRDWFTTAKLIPIQSCVFNSGGAAGSVVAARLSEIEKWNVLLVEAGPDELPGMQIPSNLQLYLSNTS